MKAINCAVLLTLLMACGATPKSDRFTTVDVRTGCQGSSSRELLKRFLGKDFSDSTFAVCGENGHFALITATNADWWDVYFCEGNNSTSMRCVGEKKIGTPLGECSLYMQQALQLKGDFLLLIHPSHGSGYAAWFPEVYSMEDWRLCKRSRNEFIQFSWPYESAYYYTCQTKYVEAEGKLYGYIDTSYYDENRQFLRSSNGKVLLAD